jgi:hypothetical protein
VAVFLAVMFLALVDGVVLLVAVFLAVSVALLGVEVLVAVAEIFDTGGLK